MLLGPSQIWKPKQKLFLLVSVCFVRSEQWKRNGTKWRKRSKPIPEIGRWGVWLGDLTTCKNRRKYLVKMGCLEGSTWLKTKWTLSCGVDECSSSNYACTLGHISEQVSNLYLDTAVQASGSQGTMGPSWKRDPGDLVSIMSLPTASSSKMCAKCTNRKHYWAWSLVLVE